jgi:2-polyprenyl-6-methoxyphenol hydroxylase-like FAD-dependent oxidoreductase
MAKRILIAAGIGGLTAASCLMKAGYDVEIYEQAPELSEIGAGIQLSANAMHVLNDLGLGEALAKPEETQEWHAGMAQAVADGTGTYFIAQPFHCAVGMKPETPT